MLRRLPSFRAAAAAVALAALALGSCDSGGDPEGGVAFGGLVGFVLYLLLTGDGSFGSVIPILSLFAFTAIRLFPALQQVYGSLGQMRFAAGTLDKLHKDFVGMATRPPSRVAEGTSAPALHLAERLELEDVHYAYPRAERAALRGMSLAIPVRSTVGIVGGTGVQRTRRVVAGIERGLLHERGMFSSIEEEGVRWPDGSFTRADAIIWATGFRPELRHLAPLGLREREGGIECASTVFAPSRGEFAFRSPRRVGRQPRRSLEQSCGREQAAARLRACSRFLELGSDFFVRQMGCVCAVPGSPVWVHVGVGHLC